MVYTNSDHFKLLLTHILLAFLHRPFWRGFVALIASPADILRGASRVPAPRSWGRNAWRTPKNVCGGGYCFDCFIFSLALLNFFVFFSSSSRSQQRKPRTDAESVGRGNVNFFAEFYLSFLRIKRCGRCRYETFPKKDLFKKTERIDSKFSVILLNQEKECYKWGDRCCNI